MKTSPKTGIKPLFIFIWIAFISVSCQHKELTMGNTSMEGTIKQGAKLVILPFEQISRNQVIAFTYKDNYLGEQTAVFRVVGLPGDTIRISQGQVFVNEKLFKEPEEIKFSYQVILDGNLKEADIAGMEYQQINPREYFFYLTRKEADKLRYNPVVTTLRIMVRDWGIYQPGLFGSDTVNKWNVDNYGAIKVPLPGEFGATEKWYFVMGDNRHNAIDSRYIGYVPESKILGVVKYQ